MQNFVPIQIVCRHYQVEEAFMNHLTEYGLIETVFDGETQCIDMDQLHKMEKIIRMYHELEVNMEGIDVIFNLLQKIMALQDELARTRDRLRIYED
jgi:hypothetical protein